MKPYRKYVTVSRAGHYCLTLISTKYKSVKTKSGGWPNKTAALAQETEEAAKLTIKIERVDALPK